MYCTFSIKFLGTSTLGYRSRGSNEWLQRASMGPSKHRELKQNGRRGTKERFFLWPHLPGEGFATNYKLPHLSALTSLISGVEVGPEETGMTGTRITNTRYKAGPGGLAGDVTGGVAGGSVVGGSFGGSGFVGSWGIVGVIAGLTWTVLTPLQRPAVLPM